MSFSTTPENPTTTGTEPWILKESQASPVDLSIISGVTKWEQCLGKKIKLMAHKQGLLAQSVSTVHDRIPE